MKPGKTSQANLVLEYLRQGHSITSLEALTMFRCLRLASRINELKTESGVDIKAERINDPLTGKHYSRYTLAPPRDLCTVCHENVVDVDNGFDTCPNCSSRI